jgi:CHAT domain-containing protein
MVPAFLVRFACWPFLSSSLLCLLLAPSCIFAESLDQGSASGTSQEIAAQEKDAPALLRLGLLQAQNHDYSAAVATFQVLVREHLQRLDRLNQARLFVSLGISLEGEGDFENALIQYDRALPLLKADSTPEGAAVAASLYATRAATYRQIGQYEQAIEDYRLAAKKWRETGAKEDEAKVLAELADLYASLGDFKSAVLYYKQALALYRLQRERPRALQVLSRMQGIGGLSGALSPNEMIEIANEASSLVLSLEEQSRSERDLLSQEIRAYGARSSTQRRILEMVDMMRSIDAKYPWSPGQNTGERQAAMEGIAGLLEISGFLSLEFSKLMPQTRMEFLANLMKAEGDWYRNGGLLHFFLREFESGKEFLSKALLAHTLAPIQGREHLLEVATDYYALGEAYLRLKQNSLALENFYKALLIRSLLQSLEAHWAYSGIARSLAAMSQSDAAVTWFKAGLGQLDAIQASIGSEEIRADLLSASVYAYRSLVSVLVSLYQQTGRADYFQQAFYSNERLRGRAFLDILAKSRVTQLPVAAQGLVAEQERIRRQISSVHLQLKAPKLAQEQEERLLARLSDLRQESQNIHMRVAAADPRHRDLVAPDPATLERVQAVLAPDTVLLEYFGLAEGPVLLWGISKDRADVYVIPYTAQDLEALKQFVLAVREPLLGEEEFKRYRDLGLHLYDQLVKPAAALLHGKTRLIIVPDGVIAYLPFEALVSSHATEQPSQSNTSLHLRTLLQDFEITYAPSASALLLLHEQPSKGNQRPPFQWAGFGDPVYEHESPSQGDRSRLSGNTSRLSFSGEEVRRIADMLGITRDSPHVNLRDQASLKRVQAMNLSQYQILHFATHAVAPEMMTYSDQPALILSSSSNHDFPQDRLRFTDILNLRLNADLVILSGCETMLGPFTAAEGIVGLSRAFLYAGANSLVVSLWRVEDQSTSLLMERFYRRLKAGESKSKALRGAKLETMQESIKLAATGKRQSLASPFFWAPFILIGGTP